VFCQWGLAYLACAHTCVRVVCACVCMCVCVVKRSPNNMLVATFARDYDQLISVCTFEKHATALACTLTLALDCTHTDVRSTCVQSCTIPRTNTMRSVSSKMRNVQLRACTLHRRIRRHFWSRTQQVFGCVPFDHVDLPGPLSL
jgi:hypothetical protein